MNKIWWYIKNKELGRVGPAIPLVNTVELTPLLMEAWMFWA